MLPIRFRSSIYPKMLETMLLKELVSEAKMPGGAGGESGARGGSATGR